MAVLCECVGSRHQKQCTVHLHHHVKSPNSGFPAEVKKIVSNKDFVTDGKSQYKNTPAKCTSDVVAQTFDGINKFCQASDLQFGALEIKRREPNGPRQPLTQSEMMFTRSNAYTPACSQAG